MATVTQVRQRAAAAPSSPATSPLPSTDSAASSSSLPTRVPVETPPFKLADLRRAIPAHCFQRSLATSYLYVAVDVCLIAFFIYLVSFVPSVHLPAIFPAFLSSLLRVALWLLYAVAAGSVGTGLWVIGHECGHGAFGNTAAENDVPGFILHSLLLVPYYSWKISHRRHHSNTGNLDKDEVFVPEIDRSQTAAPSVTQEDVEEPLDLSLTYTIACFLRFLNICKMLFLGWPAYLFLNLTANRNYPADKWVNHFNPYSPIFDKQEKEQIIMSDIGVISMSLVLIAACSYFSFSTVCFYYFGPYLVVNLCLVLITYLQHTDLRLPHYEESQWDWLKGALATIDRDYGLWNVLFHNITDTHVAHHLFSTMPHYHAQEATKAIKPILGKYYAFDDTPIPVALWKIYGRCNAVKPDATVPGVMWF